MQALLHLQCAVGTTCSILQPPARCAGDTMVARYALAACLLHALSAAAGVAALESGNLAYLSPVVELPTLAKEGAGHHVQPAPA